MPRKLGEEVSQPVQRRQVRALQNDLKNGVPLAVQATALFAHVRKEHSNLRDQSVEGARGLIDRGHRSASNEASRLAPATLLASATLPNPCVLGLNISIAPEQRSRDWVTALS